VGKGGGFGEEEELGTGWVREGVGGGRGSGRGGRGWGTDSRARD
jgi:hypothetical protein